MTFRSQLKLDLSKWSHNPALTQFAKQLNGYEKRVADFVKDFDLKSRDARERSRKQLDTFLNQVKKTRNNVEKKVTSLVNLEGQRLNKRVNELLAYLKTVAQKESAVLAGKARGKAKRKPTKARAKKSTAKKSTAKKTASKKKAN